jgi:precorrin-2 dehydrogenase / sirohydrochlorin ferrochelatase
MPGYPIELDLRGKMALVVGLGHVGRRKAAGLAAAGASVIGVDPRGVPEVLRGVLVRCEAYRPEQLQGVSLAWAAAPAEVNRRVVADARHAGIWVGSASDPGTGDFMAPAIWREGPLTLTVSTSGASPALAAALRDRAAEALSPAAGLVGLFAELRPQVVAQVSNPDARRRLLTAWADPYWLDLWLSEGEEAVRRRLVERLEQARLESATRVYSPLPPPPNSTCQGKEPD